MVSQQWGHLLLLCRNRGVSHQPRFLAWTCAGSHSSSESVGWESGVCCHRPGFCWHSSVSSRNFCCFCDTCSLSHQEKFLW